VRTLVIRHGVWFVLAVVLAVPWTLAAGPAAAEAPGGASLSEQPAAPLTEEKQEEAPNTAGPLITDGCIPIEEHHASLQVLGALSIFTANFTPNWRSVSTKGNFYTFNMPVKFTYGPAKNLETYIVAPFLVDWANNVDRSLAGPNGERAASYAGIGDITTVAKYLVLPEGDPWPAVSLEGGVGWPSGHASHLNPWFLGQDAVGTGSFSFTTGINLFKWLKPFLLNSNIWVNSPVNLFKLRGSDFPQDVRNRENVTFNLAAEYPLNKQWILLLEMYSTWTWQNPGTESLGFQSPTTLLGFLPGIEYLATDKWSFSAGCAFDTIGKFDGQKITPTVSVYYNF
jgi:outer membrane putative beta-barrel porin/alpha-amylase